MSLNNINSVTQNLFSPSLQKNSLKMEESNNTSFASMLQDSINNVSKLEKQSDVLTNKLINGEKVELHEVMVASQKATIALQTTVEVRNKVVEAYQEIMRMQM